MRIKSIFNVQNFNNINFSAGNPNMWKLQSSDGIVLDNGLCPPSGSLSLSVRPAVIMRLWEVQHIEVSQLCTMWKPRGKHSKFTPAAIGKYVHCTATRWLFQMSFHHCLNQHRTSEARKRGIVQTHTRIQIQNYFWRPYGHFQKNCTTKIFHYIMLLQLVSRITDFQFLLTGGFPFVYAQMFCFNFLLYFLIFNSHSNLGNGL